MGFRAYIMVLVAMGLQITPEGSEPEQLLVLRRVLHDAGLEKSARYTPEQRWLLVKKAFTSPTGEVPVEVASAHDSATQHAFIHRHASELEAKLVVAKPLTPNAVARFVDKSCAARGVCGVTRCVCVHRCPSRRQAEGQDQLFRRFASVCFGTCSARVSCSFRSAAQRFRGYCEGQDWQALQLFRRHSRGGCFDVDCCVFEVQHRLLEIASEDGQP